LVVTIHGVIGVIDSQSRTGQPLIININKCEQSVYYIFKATANQKELKLEKKA
jgi:hypothetical protein